ncbi:MAG: RNA-binding transcriptional accessory protein [Muribaculaceae bacterium]|nr:RNA-binding transcriptional accessory protein [Muribaculaceae bacterium]
MDKISQAVSRRLNISADRVAATISLLDEGATVPFISRYRKEKTGSLDEVAVRAIETALKAERELEARKEFVAKSIEGLGKLTPELSHRIDEADSMTAIEDIYAPYKPKKRTRATIARERGLEPLARMIMSARSADCAGAARRFVGKNGVENVEEAIAGASDIIAEWASESTRLRNITRNLYQRHAALTTSPAKGKEEEVAASPYAGYASFSQGVRHMSSHQYLALRRAEREGLVKVRYSLDLNDDLYSSLSRAFLPRGAAGECAAVIEGAVKDAGKRLLQPSVENEVSASLKEQADKVAIDIFSDNLRQLLLASPLKGRRVLAIDPGYRTGCKVVALDSQGNLLEDAVIYPAPPKQDIQGARSVLERLIRRHRLDAIALGNGTASHETEKFLKESGLMEPSRIYVVSESGASVYSASDIAREEFPDKDVTVRGAVSIGRRLIDPLAELVKIDPKAIGVGQYQHDVDQGELKNALDYTVMSCVNAVGVDVNTASGCLLAYVSGIGPALAANIVNYRAQNGDFKTRKDLKKVPRLGAKAFEQAAGFLRVPGGEEPLDNTGIHPESYGVVERMAKVLGVKTGDLPGNKKLLDAVDVKRMAAECKAGEETLRDILAELRKPGRDPRVDNDNEAFVAGVGSFEDLREGMVLPGIVNNITAFGAFVNLGIKENGLIHISQMSRRRIQSVGEVLRLGQRVEVKVIEIDASRRRIALSLLL